MSKAEFEQSKVDAYNALPGDLGYIDCPLCHNKGMLSYINEDGVQAFRDCDCVPKRRAMKFISRSGLKDLLNRYTFPAFTTEETWQEDAKRKAMAFAEHPNGWLVMSGRPGSGKTHLCTAICGELLNRGVGVRYFLWRTEAPGLKAKASTEEYEDAVRPYKTVPVLYIDDFWKGKTVTDADLNLAFDILNARYNNDKLITIISSERTIPDILNTDEAIGSRIYERSRGNYISIVGENRNWRMLG